MKPVYTWPLIYILLLLLPTQIPAQPIATADLKSCIGYDVMETIASAPRKNLRMGEVVSYLGRRALVAKESTSSPGYFDVITSIEPLKVRFMYFEDVIPLQPAWILRDLTLVEKLSNN